MRLIQSCLAALVLAAVAALPARAMPITDEVIFLLDSSGSIANTAPGGGVDLSNWTAQIDFAKSLYESIYKPDGSVAFGLINFSGCTASTSPATCADPFSPSYRLRIEHDFTDGQSDSDLDALFDGLDDTDFLRGHSWIDDALQLAHNMFAGSPNVGDNPNRTIILLTDGNPTNQHEPWDVGGGFQSNNTQSLLALNVVLNLVAVDIDPASDPDFFGFTPNLAVLDDPSTFSALQVPLASASAPASVALALPILLLVRTRRGRRR
ncbi:MAG: vWA domain-containing protein [Pseudomonadota bacterium]